MISNTRLLINELQRMLSRIEFNDFETEYITVELGDEQYVIDSICLRQTNSDPAMRHMCLKLVEPRDIGGGVIR